MSSIKTPIQGSASINSMFYRILPSFSTSSRSFFSQLVMISTIFVLFVAFLPYVSSSPTPPSIPTESSNNNHNDDKSLHDSNALMFDRNDYQANSKGDLSASSSVHEQQSPASSSSWFGQPRAHANQFLMSHVNDNEVIVPKWFTQLNNNDDDDDNNDDDANDDYVPSSLSVNKRSSFYNMGGYQTLKKRKQMQKAPMEVMNEIVNSIYLKR